MSEAGARVLVTGALGVNGVWVLRELLERGAIPIATDAASHFGLAPELEDEVEFRVLDVTGRDPVDAVVAEVRPDVVAHMAAMLPAQAQADPYRGYEVNVMGTAHVLRAARRNGVPRVVFTSSKGAYGAVGGVHAHPDYKPLSEDDRCHPVAVYDHAKLASEGLGENYARTGGPDFVSLRFATIYGPGKLERHGPMSMVSQVVEDAFAGRATRFERGAQQRDDLLYVRDVGAAVVTAALHPRRFEHRVFNIGTGRGVSLDELSAVVRAELPGADIEIGDGLDPMGFGVSYYGVMDVRRARDELGFEATYNIESGVADYARALAAAASSPR